ncbi:MAG: VanW family protein, partial [Vallitaleaceae bacterium]|nr:VanW family protein [Vallitaleaceae bacterium]
MNKFLYMKPKIRSNLRLFIGTRVYRLKRYFTWYFDHNRYAKKLKMNQLEYSITSHETPLYRRLKDVDMWLQHNKVDNLKIAIEKINGIIIRPGETFSYWKLIGKPTYNKGYKDGMILNYGKFKASVGGGLCQLSNMIYWMTLHTPLTVTERYRHSYDVFPDSRRTQPFGSGATCVYNYRDLGFKNDTNESYQINLRFVDNNLNGEILSDSAEYFEYEVYEAKHEITREYWGAYIRHNEIRRRV